MSPDTAPRVHWLYAIANHPLHTGAFWGLPGRVAMMLLSGLSPVVLFLTGLWMYGKKRLARRRAEATRRVAAPAQAPELAAKESRRF